MQIRRRFVLTGAAVLALAAGSGGGWALAQSDNESTGSEHSAVEPSGDDSVAPSEPSGENESSTSAEENEGVSTETQAVTTSESETAAPAPATQSEANFTG